MQQKVKLFSSLQNALKAWKKPLMKSNTATRFCKRCYKEIRDNSWSNLIFERESICSKCFHELDAKLTHFKVMNYEAISVYEYSQEIRSLLYQFKGCFDFELHSVFLEYLKPYFALKYHGYSIICAPSSKEHNQSRGFNHVKEIFKELGKEEIDALRKIENRKQTNQSLSGRHRVGEILRWNDSAKVRGKKILFVDDVYTTGSTCKACLSLIKKHHPKKIKVLVMSKTTAPRNAKT